MPMPTVSEEIQKRLVTELLEYKENNFLSYAELSKLVNIPSGHLNEYCVFYKSLGYKNAKKIDMFLRNKDN